MPTVLVFARNLLPLSETFIKEQILALTRWRGILVGNRQIAGLSLAGLELRLVESNSKLLFDRVARKLRRTFGIVPRSFIRSLERESASLLHAHFGSDAVEAWPLARKLALPMIVTLHGYDITIRRDWWEEGHEGPEMRDYPGRLLEQSRQQRVHFIAVSKAIRSRAIVFGIPEEKISVQYIGIDCRKFSPSGPPITERGKTVLFVGRLVEKKGCEYLIRAIAKVQDVVAGVRLTIVGDGPLRSQLEALAGDLGVIAEFRGALAYANVRRELDAARIFCLPSVTAHNGDAEGFGLVLLEAQACGVPVISSAQGGATEGLQEGLTGFSFREKDVEDLAVKLQRLLANDELTRKLAVAAPAFVAENFDIRRCTQELEKLYDQIAQ
jgi:glycosyltransferase involved in cell wall biosynthesis